MQDSDKSPSNRSTVLAALPDASLHPASPVQRTAAEIATFSGGVRASSPAKRSRSDRDGDGEESDTSDNTMDLDGNNGVHRSPSKKHNSQQIQSPLPNRTRVMPSDTTVQQSESGSNSIRGEVVAESTSSEGNPVPVSSPPTSVEMDCDANAEPSRPSWNQQRQMITEEIGRDMVEGQKAFVIPKTWLNRVLAKSAGGEKDFSKEERQIEPGPIDTRTILASPVSNNPAPRTLEDGQGNMVMPLAAGLQLGTDIEAISQSGWDQLIKWYGLAKSAPEVVRFVVNTNFESEGLPNHQYELYPPVFTIQKLGSDSGRGLDSIADVDRQAIQLLASRSDHFQHFLKRLKAALDIPIRQKIQLWKILETLQPTPGRAGIPTPMASRSASPAPASARIPVELPKLFVDVSSLNAMPEGTQRELLQFNDETMNEKYNGHLRLGQIGFSEKQTLIVETTGRDANEFASQKQAAKKTTAATSSATKGATASTSALSRPSANTRSARSPTPGVLTTRGRRDRKGRTKGSVGLQNLGNTCYMNSALQCIRSVEELTIYFLKEKYKDEINSDNPLGHGGAIAKAYAGLISSLYTTDSSFSPRNFKSTVGRCQPLFSGYGQQDSQEFLGFLIDGLHEDLNRIAKKPYVENPDSDDNRVEDPEYIRELGEIYRDNHHQRNHSVAMDLFSGFYKNTMVCPVCDKISVTFDPYAQVTLQLPVENTFAHVFHVIPLRGSIVQVDVDTDKNTSFKSLKDYLAKRVTGIKASNLVFAEEYGEKFYKIFEDSETLGDAGIQITDKLVAYELDDSPTNWPPLDKKKKRGLLPALSPFSSSSENVPEMSAPAADRMAVPVYSRLLKSSTSRTGSSYVLYPFFILITREEAKDYEAILRKLLLKIDTMTTKDVFEECEFASMQPSENEEVNEDKDIPKIHARSVEGDDELVDVSMTNGPAVSQGSPSKVGGASPHDVRSKVLNQKTFLDVRLRNLFEIGVYNGNNEVIPTNNISISDRLPSLWDRAHPRDSRRLSNSSWGGRQSHSRNGSRWRHGEDAQSTDGSEDELTSSDAGMSQSTADISTSADAESDGGDTSATEHSLSTTRKPGPKRGSNTMRSLRKYGRDLKNSMRRSKSRGTAQEYILHLGDGLLLDWNAEVFDALFCGEGPDDEFKGERTDKEISKVPDPELDQKRANRSARKNRGVTLDECFAETAKSEILSEDNAWYCPKCKEFRRATKTLELWTVPDILVVHLKRFAGSGGRYLSNKVDVHVDFPVEGLDLSGRVGLPEDKSFVYDLFAVDNHYGGLGGGHYTAYAQNFLDKKWYEYNDTFVASSSGEAAVTKAAYLLFYRRRQPRHLGPPALQQMVEEAYEGESEDSAEAGKDQTGDSTSSGSSDDSTLGGMSSRTGIASGGTGQRSMVADKLADYDEGISMEADNPDDPLPGLEDPSASRAIGPVYGQTTWGFDKLVEGATAPPGSENGSDNETLASNEPDAGGDLQDRMVEEFSDSDMAAGGGQMAHLPPGDADAPFAHVTPMEQDEHDAPVAEVRLSDEEGH